MSTLPAVVFATPASLAEHGAAVRAAWAAVRRMLAAGTTAVTGAAARQLRARPLSHDEMARRRLVEQALDEMRRGAYADAALGGPRPR